MRTCVGCGTAKPKQELVRIVDAPNGITIDTGGKAPGRGVYICNSKDCLEMAWKKNGIKRSLKKNIDAADMDRLYEEISSYGQSD